MPTEQPAPANYEQPRGSHTDFLKSQFDKLLMTGIFLTMLFVYFHVLHHNPDQSASTWLQQKTGEVLASILTLTAARAFMSRGSGDGKPQGK